MLEEKLIRIMRTYPPFARDLERVRLLRLPDGWTRQGTSGIMFGIFCTAMNGEPR